VEELTNSDYYKDLNIRLKELTKRVREIKSVTIGVNLDSRLHPESAGVLSVNNERFKSGELLQKILRLDFKNDEYTCIASLQPFKKGQGDNQQTALENAFNNALNDVFKSSMRSWKKVVSTYILENADFLIKLAPEIEFITKATELVKSIKETGNNLVFPEIYEVGEKVFDAKGIYNPVVAIKICDKMVENDFAFDKEGMFYVLSGPNRGGKSVITCAVGHTFALAQLGLPVPAKSAKISPVDGIFTHFPTDAEDTIDKGRLGEECARLDEIFEQITENSLVLLDESLSSTGSYEASYIASEVLSGLLVAGCRGIFSTHLHELGMMIDDINQRCQRPTGEKIDTLVAGIEDGERSFVISRKKPDGKSYARDIASKYGISLEKIIEKIEKNK
jgi:DNA mismatch repair ATPase MutS